MRKDNATRPRFDIEHAKGFLKALFPRALGRLWLEFRLLHALGGPARQLYVRTLDEIAWRQVSQTNASGASITFSAALRRRRSGKKEDAAALTALWADLDAKRFNDSKQAAVKAVFSLPPELHPSALVDSGHGIHAWWFLETPVAITDANRQSLENILRRLHRAIGSDAVHDLSRVMRLPGSINVKDAAAPVACRLISLAANRRFQLDAFAGLPQPETAEAPASGHVAFSPTPLKLPLSSLRVSGRIKDLIRNGWRQGSKYHSRSEADQAVVTALRQAGYGPDEIRALFTNPKCGIGSRYREVAEQRGAAEANRQLARCIEHADAFLDSERRKNGPDILFVPNATPPNLATVQAVVTKAFPELWPVVLAAMATVTAMLPDDVVNPPALILEGASSAGKTTVIDMIDSTPYLAYRSDKFTPQAFVTHSANLKEADIAQVDLLPRIRFRCMLTGELAPLFRGREDELTSNFSTLTAVMDGRGLMSDSGARGRRGYEGDYLFSWLGATTPLPSRTWRIMQQLGARLLFYWVDLKVPDVSAIVENLTGPAAYKAKLAACRAAVNEFLLGLFRAYSRKDTERPFGITWNRAADPSDVIEHIARLVGVAAQARAVVSGWQDDQGHINFQPPNIEHPHRLATLLYNLARGHALLHDRTQLSEDDKWLVTRVALDSMPIDRRKMLRLLITIGPDAIRDSRQVGEALDCSRPTAIRLMREMELLRIAKVFEDDSEKDEGDRPRLLIELRRELSWLATPTVRTALGIPSDMDAGLFEEAHGMIPDRSTAADATAASCAAIDAEISTGRTDPCKRCGKIDWFKMSPTGAELCGHCQPDAKVHARYRARKRAEQRAKW